MNIQPIRKASYVAFVMAVLVGVIAIIACGGDPTGQRLFGDTQRRQWKAA